LFGSQPFADSLTAGNGHSMGDENEPDQAANNKDYRDGNEYLLQYFHIFLLIRLMCMSRQRIFGICS